jgi:P-type E1-E2 ATPase
VLEKLPICSTAIFDKTGTLTRGTPELTDIITLDGFNKSSVLQMAASLERYSRHPLASAIVDAATKENLAILEVEDISEKPGQGLFGNIAEHQVFVTHRKKLSEKLAKQADLLPQLQRGLECLVVVDERIAAVFHFRDTVRSDGHLFINHLGPQHNFKKIMLVSGDRSSEVEYLAQILEIKETHSSQTPEQKLEIVRRENAAAPTLFMGDGINDAPALTAATVGIAFGQNSGVTSEAAGAVIMESSLAKVDQLIHISEDMRRIALQSAIGGMLFSFLGMGLAAAGYLSPVGGALLQEVIDVVAILNALRLTWKSSIKADVR